MKKLKILKLLLSMQKKATVAIQSHQGNFLCRGGKNICLEGSAKPRTVVVEFPSFDLAKQAYTSNEYKEALNILKGSVERNLQIIEGI